jgi:hypothetical protein
MSGICRQLGVPAAISAPAWADMANSQTLFLGNADSDAPRLDIGGTA